MPDGQLLKECRSVFPHAAAAPAVKEPGCGGVCWMTGDLKSPIRFGYFLVIL